MWISARLMLSFILHLLNWNCKAPVTEHNNLSQIKLSWKFEPLPCILTCKLISFQVITFLFLWALLYFAPLISRIRVRLAFVVDGKQSTFPSIIILNSWVLELQQFGLVFFSPFVAADLLSRRIPERSWVLITARQFSPHYNCTAIGDYLKVF